MAVAFESGRGAGTGAAVSSLASASASPNANTFFLTCVTSFISGGTPAAPATVVPGFAGTFTKLADFAFQTVGANDTRITAWGLFVPPSPGSGVVTADWAGVNQTSCSIRNMSFTGADPAAFGQSATGTGTGLSGSATLPALRDSNGMTVGAIVHNVNEVITVGSGYTIDANLSGTPPVMATEWKANATLVDASWATSSAWGILGLELTAAELRSQVNVIDFAVARAANY